MSVCCECCMLSGRGLCDELITRPEESYRLWCVVCDLETSWIRRPGPTWGCRAKRKKTTTKVQMIIQIQYADLRVFAALPIPLHSSLSTDIQYERSQGNPLFRRRF